jgi:hypothetical protein
VLSLGFDPCDAESLGRRDDLGDRVGAVNKLVEFGMVGRDPCGRAIDPDRDLRSAFEQVQHLVP